MNPGPNAQAGVAAQAGNSVPCCLLGKQMNAGVQIQVPQFQAPPMPQFQMPTPPQMAYPQFAAPPPPPPPQMVMPMQGQLPPGYAPNGTITNTYAQPYELSKQMTVAKLMAWVAGGSVVAAIVVMLGYYAMELFNGNMTLPFTAKWSESSREAKADREREAKEDLARKRSTEDEMKSAKRAEEDERLRKQREKEDSLHLEAAAAAERRQRDQDADERRQKRLAQIQMVGDGNYAFRVDHENKKIFLGRLKLKSTDRVMLNSLIAEGYSEIGWSGGLGSSVGATDDDSEAVPAATWAELRRLVEEERQAMTSVGGTAFTSRFNLAEQRAIRERLDRIMALIDQGRSK